jgi:hypothetical protein
MANAPTVTKTPTVDELMNLVKSLSDKIESLEAARSAGVVISEKSSTVYAKKPWEEEIWVEAVRDCTYPNLNDTYPQYRTASKDANIQGEVFRIAHREHLNDSMRELKPGAERPTKPVKEVPQTAARGVRVMTQPH